MTALGKRPASAARDSRPAAATSSALHTAARRSGSPANRSTAPVGCAGHMFSNAASCNFRSRSSRDVSWAAARSESSRVTLAADASTLRAFDPVSALRASSTGGSPHVAFQGDIANQPVESGPDYPLISPSKERAFRAKWTRLPGSLRMAPATRACRLGCRGYLTPPAEGKLPQLAQPAITRPTPHRPHGSNVDA